MDKCSWKVMFSDVSVILFTGVVGSNPPPVAAHPLWMPILYLPIWTPTPPSPSANPLHLHHQTGSDILPPKRNMGPDRK